MDHLRTRTAQAILTWSLFPLAFALLSVWNGRALSAVFCTLFVLVALAAAFLTTRATWQAHIASVSLLIALWIPFAYLTIRRLAFPYDGGALRVADSPGGYLIGAFVESLFVVPLGAFALSIWRRRTRRDAYSGATGLPK